MAFVDLLQRLARLPTLREAAGLLPGPVVAALDALAHASPAERQINREPGPDGRLSAADLYLGSIGPGTWIEGVNLFEGSVDGGALRACNLALAVLNSGEVHAVNCWRGPIHDGWVRAANIIVGDVGGGRVEASHLLIGDIYGGAVEVDIHVGRVLGGRCHCRLRAETLEALAEQERPPVADA